MGEWREIRKTHKHVSLHPEGTAMEVNDRMPMGGGSLCLYAGRGGLSLIRYSKNGSKKYRLSLYKDGVYRLGPDYGYRVSSPRKEPDPVKRAMRMLGVPIKNLRVTSTPRPIDEMACDTPHSHGHSWVHDGSVVDTGHRTIKGFTFAAHVDTGACKGKEDWLRITEVIVTPKCNPFALADALTPVVYGDGADSEYLRGALHYNRRAARRWLDKAYTIEPAHHGDRLLVDNKPYILGLTRPQQPTPLFHLVAKYGVGFLEAYYGEPQFAYALALDNPKEAARYVLTHYRIVTQEEGRNDILFAELDTPNRLRPLSARLGDDARPLRVLRDTHGRALVTLLLERAERV